MKRREFLKTVAASGAVLAGGRWALADEAAVASTNRARLARRPYGKHGDRLSLIGFPGFALRGAEPRDVRRAVGQSVEAGVNYFDVAPSYGNAEELLGPALEPYRKNVFLACKTAMRDAAGAAKELAQSLERLRTDHFDLYQLHHITDVDKDVEAVFAKGGAMELFVAAKKDGRVRHLGFSAHSIAAALRAMELYDFDSALVPVNFACWYEGDFGPTIVETARKKGVTLLAIKALARQLWPKGADRSGHPNCWYQPITDRAEGDLSLRWTLNQPVAAAIPPADLTLLPMAIELGLGYRPISEAETKRLATLADTLRPVFRA
jgi:aryl-alcohol dehydrogenase-like predicted oxidoreductase